MSAGGALVLVVGCVGVLALAVLKKLLVDEASGLLTSLSESLIRRAAKRVSSHGDRYLEEWLGELAALKERRLSGLRYAVSVLRGSRSLSVTLERLGPDPGVERPPASIATVTADLENLARRLSGRHAPSALTRSRTSPQQFAAFYEQRAPAVLRYFARQTGEPQRAYDLTADVFAKAYEKRESFQGDTEKRADAWLWGIVRHEYAAYKRGQLREVAALNQLRRERPVREEHARQLEERAGEQAARDHVRTAMAALPAPQREVIVLRFVKNLSYPEIAEALEISSEQARRRVSLALEALRANAAIRQAAEELRPRE